ncbi:hypothetical protein F5888DRAFT_1672439, partial [Russula emetica]
MSDTSRYLLSCLLVIIQYSRTDHTFSLMQRSKRFALMGDLRYIYPVFCTVYSILPHYQGCYTHSLPFIWTSRDTYTHGRTAIFLC